LGLDCQKNRFARTISKKWYSFIINTIEILDLNFRQVSIEVMHNYTGKIGIINIIRIKFFIERISDFVSYRFFIVFPDVTNPLKFHITWHILFPGTVLCQSAWLMERDITSDGIMGTGSVTVLILKTERAKRLFWISLYHFCYFKSYKHNLRKRGYNYCPFVKRATQIGFIGQNIFNDND
jgi:hypothetical protein